MLRLTAAAALIFLLPGCAVGRTDFSRLNPGEPYEPLPFDAPIYLTTMGTDQPFEEIGFIHVSDATRIGYEKLNEKLRLVAREKGADAVLYVSYGLENAGSIIPFFVAIPYDVLTVQGLAVKMSQVKGKKR